MSRFELKKVTGSTLLFVFGVSLYGCTVWPQKEDFGDAVTHMQTEQKATPATQAAPQDGQRMRSVLRVYREDVGKPQEVKQEITINVGEQRN